MKSSKQHLDTPKLAHGYTKWFGQYTPAIPIFSEGWHANGDFYRIFQKLTRTGVVLEQFVFALNYAQAKVVMMVDSEGEI